MAKFINCSRNSVSLVVAVFIALSSVTAFGQRLIEINKLTVDSVNLTAGQFFKSYMSNDSSERKSAELYLLGVMDATEGKSWCDYRTFKTITLRERIFEEFKKLDSSLLDERASTVIGDILRQRYPCGRRK